MRSRLLLLLAACGGGENVNLAERSTVPLTPSVRDSAGVTIYEHPADALERAPEISIDTVALATIEDPNDPELDFSRGGRPLMTKDGSIVAFLDGSVYRFGSDGVMLERIGRSGDGPGEFRMGNLALGLGDTILVGDMRTRRISFLVPEQGFVRARSVLLFTGGVIYVPAGQLGDDTILLRVAGPSIGPNLDPGRLPAPVSRLAAGSDSIEVLIPLDGMDLVTMPNNAFGLKSLPSKHSPDAIAAQWGDEILAGRGDRWLVSRYRTDGSVAAHIVVDRPRIPIDDQIRTREIEAELNMTRRRLAGMPAAAAAETTVGFNFVRDQPFTDSLPAFAGLDMAPGGTAWIRDAQFLSDSTWAYTALRRDGTILGRLKGSGPLPVAFGDDRIILRTEDENGIVTWRVHRLDMP